MSIFDTRKTCTAVIRSEDGDVAVYLPEHGTTDYPWTGFDGPFDMDDMDETYVGVGSITATAEHVGTATEHGEMDWAHHKFRVRMLFEGRQMTTTFRVGMGWTEAPSAQDVLESMFSDYESLRYEGAESLGYEGAEAAKIERAVERQTERLIKFLG